MLVLSTLKQSASRQAGSYDVQSERGLSPLEQAAWSLAVEPQSEELDRQGPGLRGRRNGATQYGYF